MRSTLLACAAMLALAGCLEKSEVDAQNAAAEEQLAQIQAAPAGPPLVEGEIDWEAARTARAQSAPADGAVQIQQATGEPASVPMLLPSGVVLAQNARPPSVVTTGDGYFATYNMPRYDAIVNGTKSAVAAGAPAADKEAMKFTLGEASAQMSFSRFGADYLIEFECREVDGGDSCITEAEALEFAETLFVAQTQ